jgi:hypothetical protein
VAYITGSEDVHPLTAGRQLCIAVAFREYLHDPRIHVLTGNNVIKVNATDMDVAARYLTECDAKAREPFQRL